MELTKEISEGGRCMLDNKGGVRQAFYGGVTRIQDFFGRSSSEGLSEGAPQRLLLFRVIDVEKADPAVDCIHQYPQKRFHVVFNRGRWRWFSVEDGFQETARQELQGALKSRSAESGLEIV